MRERSFSHATIALSILPAVIILHADIGMDMLSAIIMPDRVPIRWVKARGFLGIRRRVFGEEIMRYPLRHATLTFEAQVNTRQTIPICGIQHALVAFSGNCALTPHIGHNNTSRKCQRRRDDSMWRKVAWVCCIGCMMATLVK